MDPYKRLPITTKKPAPFFKNAVWSLVFTAPFMTSLTRPQQKGLDAFRFAKTSTSMTVDLIYQAWNNPTLEYNILGTRLQQAFSPINPLLISLARLKRASNSTVA